MITNNKEINNLDTRLDKFDKSLKEYEDFCRDPLRAVRKTKAPK